MSRKLFQEILEFKKYGNCLGKKLYQEYRNYLVEKVLEEITAKNLANSFRTIIFKPNEIDSENATINVMKKVVKATQQSKYERKFNKIEPTDRTHLEIESGLFCTKEVFQKEFEKEEFENKDDLSAKYLANKLLDRYLEIYDDGGWLISKVDDYSLVKDVEIPGLVS